MFIRVDAGTTLMFVSHLYTSQQSNLTIFQLKSHLKFSGGKELICNQIKKKKKKKLWVSLYNFSY